MFGECHAHLFMNGYDYKKAAAFHKNQVRDQEIRTWFKAYEEKKIRFVRDGGDAYGVSKRAKELAVEYEVDYRTPIFAIHKNGHYGGIVGFGFDTMKEYRELVLLALREGADFIKIMVSGIMDFDQAGRLTSFTLQEEEIREMIHIAHQEGAAVMVHANGSKAVLAAAKAGADSIEHGNYIDDECLGALADCHAVWVPTLATIRNLKGCGRFSEDEINKVYAMASENLRRGYGMGVQMALGSDAGAYLVPHGQGICDEYQCFQEILGAGEELDAHLELGEKRIRSVFCR